MTTKIEKIIDNCIKLISENNLSLEQCLKRYPKFKEELRPLLESFIKVKEFEKINPSAIFEDEVKIRFINIVKAKQSQILPKKGMIPRSVTKFSGLWTMPILAKISIFVILFLFISGFTSILSADSLPGDFLYPVKLATEKVIIFFTSHHERANLHAIFAKKRLDEIERMVGKGRTVGIDEALNILESETDSAISYIEDLEIEIRTPEVIDKISENFKKQKEVLEKVKENVPDEVRIAIERVIENNIKKSSKIEEIKQNIIKRPNN
ncbi:MAG: hypothetical protein KKC53_02300 [Actinobacteria bacterium]|nr:hypothetical protein [Actinomycetota bacterium]